MSVQSTARYAGPFAGNAVTTVFAFAFKVFATTDVVVLQIVTATGVVSNPVNGVDYTVALNADQTANPGGTITFAVAPPATISPIYITSSIPKSQPSSYPNPGPWNPTTAENSWDRATAVIQEVDQAALKFAPGDVASTHVLPAPTARANTMLGFDAAGALKTSAVATATTLTNLAASAGASLIGFIQTGAGAVVRSMQDKGREIITSPDRSSGPIGITGVGVGVLTATLTGAGNTAVGASALAVNTSGYANTAIGYQAMLANTIGGSATFGGNTAVGAAAMISNISGDNNTAVGLDALYTNEVGYSNTAVGSNALGFGKDGYESVAVGFRALFNGGAAHQNTAVGVRSLNANLTGNNNVALGHFAGAYELGSNSFYVDNQDRTNTAGDKAKALLYGTFNAAPASQSLTINAVLTVPYNSVLASADLGSFGTQDILTVSGQASGTGPLAVAQNSAKNAYRPFTLNSSAFSWGQGATQVAFSTTGITAAAATAIPAGGAAATGFLFSATGSFGVFFGSGAPTVVAAKGSLYLRSDGSGTTNRAYINTDGAATWTALTTVA